MESAVSEIKLVYLVGIWMEALLFGVYIYLFIPAMLLFKQKDVWKTFSLRVFFAGNCVIFFLNLIHNAMNVVQLATTFACQTDVENPFQVGNLNGKLTFGSGNVVDGILLVGDLLAVDSSYITFMAETNCDLSQIYRSFLIWGRRYPVIILPLILSFSSAGMQLTNIVWVRNVTVAELRAQGRPLLVVPLVLLIFQNVLTSGLVVVKIWLRHRQNKNVKLCSLNTPSLVSVIHIIVESALTYTAGLLLLLVFILLNHPAWYLAHALLSPLTGIVFVIILLRTNSVADGTKKTPFSASLIPTWIVSDAIFAALNHPMPPSTSILCK